ncbi:hypothetical protein [Pantoea agglomerans]
MTAHRLFQVIAHLGSAPVQRHQFGVYLLDQHPGHFLRRRHGKDGA